MFTKITKDSNTPFRLFLASQVDGGKTSSLAGLCNAGFNVYILDFDTEKFQGLKERLTDEAIEAGRLNIISLYNEFEYDKSNEIVVDRKKTAFQKSKEVMTYMKEQGILNDPENVIVFDTITNIANSIYMTEKASPDLRKTYNEAWLMFLDWLGFTLLMTKNVPTIFMCHTSLVEIDGAIPKLGVTVMSKNNNLDFPKLPGVSTLHLLEVDKKTGRRKVNTASGYKDIVKNSYKDIPNEIDLEWYLPSLINYHNTSEWVYPFKELSK